MPRIPAVCVAVVSTSPNQLDRGNYPTLQGSSGRSSEELANLAAAQLQQQYQLQNPEMAGLIAQLLKAQGLQTSGQ